MEKKQFAIILVSLIILSHTVATSTSSMNLIITKTSKGETILYVGGSGQGNYSRIQDAIDNASDGDIVFVFNGTYYENVVVNKSINLTGEGKNTTIIDGNESGDVLNISANQVNISGFTIQNGFDGVYIISNSNIVCGNIITNNHHDGIQLYNSSNNNTISGNNITKNKNIGINLVWYSSDNNISNNIIIKNFYGIYLHWSSNNTIYGHNISRNKRHGIHLYQSCNINIIENNVTENGRGFYLWYSSNLNISKNYIANNELGGISIDDSYNDTIIDNIFISNGIDLWGDYLAHYNTHKIENNTANGLPLRYYKNMNNIKVPNDTTQLIIANCSNFTIQNLNLSYADNGVQLAFSSHNVIIGNTIIGNDNIGIHLMWYSYNNTITRNNITKNGRSGIYLAGSSKNNQIYHNNFNNTQNAYDYCINIWDKGYPSGGNYWSDFHNESQGAYDVNKDDIVDSPYNISGNKSQDQYPLKFPWNGTEPTPNCGDANGDGNVDIADVVYIINYLFIQGPEPIPDICVGDCNADGSVDIADAVCLINYLFIGSPAPGGCCE